MRSAVLVGGCARGEVIRAEKRGLEEGALPNGAAGLRHAGKKGNKSRNVATMLLTLHRAPGGDCAGLGIQKVGWAPGWCGICVGSGVGSFAGNTYLLPPRLEVGTSFTVGRPQ